MTKKDYELIANGLRVALGEAVNDENNWHRLAAGDRVKDSRQQVIGIKQAMYEVAQALSTRDNSFKRDKFLTACGIED